MYEYSNLLLITRTIRIFIKLITLNIKSSSLDLGFLITLNRVLQQAQLYWHGFFPDWKEAGVSIRNYINLAVSNH